MSLFTRPAFAGWVLALSFARPVAAAVCVEAYVRPTGLPLNRSVLDAMMSEAEAIWAPYDVAIGWTAGANPDRCRSVDASVAVQIDNGLRPHSTARPLVLGTAHVGLPRRPGPVPIRVDYAAIDRLLRLLAADTLGHVLGRNELAPSDIGRALGRVLAHELGHVLLGGDRHPRKGLMRASFVPTALVDYRRRTYTLSRAEVARLAERAARRAAQIPGASMTDD